MAPRSVPLQALDEKSKGKIGHFVNNTRRKTGEIAGSNRSIRLTRERRKNYEGRSWGVRLWGSSCDI
jgi:hypothetical protein